MSKSPVSPQPNNPTAGDGGGMNIDLSAIMSMGGNAIAGIGKSIQDLTGLAASTEANVKQEAEAIKARGAAEGEISAIDYATAVKRQADALEISAMFGTNKNANSFILAGLGKEITEGAADLIKRSKDIQAKLDQGFFDNPIAWFANQISLPFDQMSFEFAGQNVQRNLGIAKEVVDRTDKAVALNNALEAGDLHAKAAAAQKLIAAKTDQDAAQAEFKLKQLGLDVINVRTNLTKSQFDIISQANSAIAQAQNLRLSELGFQLQVKADARAEAGAALEQERFDLAKNADARAAEQLELSRRSLALQETTQRLLVEEREGKAEANVMLQQQLDKVAQVTGTNRISFQQFRSLPEAMKMRWYQLMSNPEIMDRGQLASTPARALEFVNEQNFPLTAPMQQVVSELNKIRAGVIDATSKPNAGVMWHQMRPEQKEQALNAAIQTRVLSQLNNIPDSGSIYSPPTAASVFGKDDTPESGGFPFMKNTNLAKAMAAIRLDQRAPLRADDVVNAALSKMQTENIPAEVMAKEISTLYSAIIKDNNANLQYRRLGLPMLDEAVGYKQTVTAGNFTMFGGTTGRVVNLSDVNAVTAHLIRADHAMKQRAKAIQDLNAGSMLPSMGVQ